MRSTPVVQAIASSMTSRFVPSPHCNAQKVNRVLILDLDVHQGDGTAAICAAHDNIFTCSVHAESNFPFSKEQSNRDVPLADDTTDEDYLAILDQTLETLQPETYDLILYQAGVDALKDDALGRLALTREGLAKRNQRIFDLHKKHRLPTVLFMGGGYANPIELTVDAFEDLFTSAAAIQRETNAPPTRHSTEPSAG